MSCCLLASLALAALLTLWGAPAQGAAPPGEGASSTASSPAAEPSPAAAIPAAEGLPGVAGTAPAAELLPFTELVAGAPLPGAEPAASCWIQPTTDFNGGDLPSPAVATSSANDCCAACWGAPGCGVWTFRSSDVSARGRGEKACQWGSTPARLQLSCKCPLLSRSSSASSRAPRAGAWCQTSLA